MRFSRPGAWQRLLAIAPVLLVLVSLPTEVLLRCRMDGQVRAACCCARHADAEAGSSGPSVAGDPCCQREVSNRPLSLARATAPSPTAPVDAVLLPTISTLLPGQPRSAALSALRRQPARQGPPLRLLKQAFLI